jgi:hypothetical protein
MEIARFIYQDNPNYEVEFEPTGQDNVMVNATMMAAIFGKNIGNFTRNEDTKSFIKACLNNANSHYLGIKKESDLVTSKQKSGTWMHRILALKFAGWLDSDFEVWVYITIDRILNQAFREEREARQRKIYAKARKEALRLELLEKHPEWAEYFDLEDSIRQADNDILKSVKEQVKQLQLDFLPELLTPGQS